MLWLRQSTASQEVLLGPFLDKLDGDSAETALTIANTDIKLWKEGGTTESSKNSGGATHIANGRYYTVLDATDTNTLGKLEINVHVAGALAVRREFMVLPANVYDALVLGTDYLDVSAIQLAGQTITAAAGVTFPSSVASPTNITAGTITTVTNLTNLPSITAGWITAAGIAAGALNGKGDWNVGKTGYSLTQAFPTNFSAMSITAGGLVDMGASVVATAVWDAATATYGSAGSYGLLIETNLDAQVSTVGGGSLTEAGIADAVWDEVLSGHLTAGSTGYALNASGSAGDPWATALPGAYGAGTAGKIMGDNINATISSRASQTSVDTVDDLIDTEVAAIKTVVDAILVDTAVIGAAGAGLTALATQASVNAIDDLLDTEIAAIKAETASIQADTNDIQTRLPAALVGGRMDGNLSAINNSTTTLNAFERAVKGNVIGTVGSGSTTTSIVTSSVTPAASVADQFKGRLLTFADDTTTAALRGQSTDITASTASATPTITVTALTTSPTSGDRFAIT
ncbi:hypothetical protein [Nitrosovibrio sp. Nv4]|uniref:hypothetical protein n=1 Tax=Nitrosovibrio sp. Nv4 TaxID=1945880 RepID=UPI000BD0EC6C|nr:hypothetical protein [Nitrosovibrio sp. Nv4]SOD42352.1 hypothetical protein SAMN06298226_2691 [Nitrosovibrio sp. Nv4]